MRRTREAHRRRLSFGFSKVECFLGSLMLLFIKSNVHFVVSFSETTEKKMEKKLILFVLAALSFVGALERGRMPRAHLRRPTTAAPDRGDCPWTPARRSSQAAALQPPQLRFRRHTIVAFDHHC
jgi:hypothetical protein